MRTPYRTKTLLAAITLAATGNAMAIDGLTINIGTDYNSGKYGGTDRTTVLSVPVSAKYNTGPVTLRMTASWLSVTGTGAVVPGGLGGIGRDGGISGGGSGGTAGTFSTPCDNRGGARKPEDNNLCATPATTSTASTARKTEQGFGDIITAATYHALDNKGLIVDFTGKMKIATASDTKGLGSGKNDFALQVEVEQAIGSGFVNGGAGHKWLGHPDGVTLRNPWFGAVGGGFKPTSATTVGITYDYAQSARRGSDAAQELSLYASQRLNKNIKLNGYLFKGLTDSSPDWGAGIGLGYNF